MHVPDPIVTAEDDPEEHALLADSVGLALLVVLDTLSPAERLAFVLHDIFAVPFEQIGSVLDRSPAAAKQLASRARRRLRGMAPPPRPIPPGSARWPRPSWPPPAGTTSRACLRSSTRTLCSVPTRAWPDGPLPADPRRPGGIATAHRFAGLARFAHPVLVNGTPGFLVAADGQPLAVIGMAIRDDKITEINILADPERLSQLDLAGLID